MSIKYVAYYRVSTDKQGDSGAGLDAQRADVMKFIASTGGHLHAEYTDIESGSKFDRQGLQMAIATANMNGATLVVAKMDRLSRKVADLFTIRDSKIKIAICDMPDMDTLKFGIYATFAQHEREMISSRTKKALKARKDAGMVLGKLDNLTDAGRAIGRAKHSNNARMNGNNMRAYVVASDKRRAGDSFATIARVLNHYGFTTARGKAFHPNSVKQLMHVMDGHIVAM